MSMSEWAKREVEIACKREREADGTTTGEFSYGCGCYESALKAFLTLMEDGHSNNSIVFTKEILNRLINGRPLTPLTDDVSEWNLITDNNGENETIYQSRRCHSVFKYINNDNGNVRYKDTDRFVCLNKTTECIFYSGFAAKIVSDVLPPITMPYYPSAKHSVIHMEDFLYDEVNGDFDTVKIESVLYNDDIIPINKYFAEDNRTFKEISYEEYEHRYNNRVNKEC